MFMLLLFINLLYYKIQTRSIVLLLVLKIQLLLHNNKNN